jgi:cysteine desulfurase
MRIYLDHAATTALHPQAFAAMIPFLAEHPGNPSSLHSLGQSAHQALEQARVTIARLLGCAPREIIFTSGGTESDNLAIRGVAFARREHGNHIITTPIEHHAVLRTCEQLAKYFGYAITYLPVDTHGMVDPDDVARAITPHTILISVMYANNEVGTIEPIAAIGKLAREHGIVFHTDAVQAGSALNLRVNQLGVDLLSLSAHKFYGPKGVGILYVRQGIHLVPTQTGGSQEFDLRAGTENVPSIVGMAAALKIAQDNQAANNAKLATQRDRLVQGILDRIPRARLTGHPFRRLPNHASFTFEGIDPEPLILGLDREGICASSGSACSSGSLEPSHVLTAMGFPPARSLASLRMTLGSENTDADVDYVVAVLPTIIERIQEITATFELKS